VLDLTGLHFRAGATAILHHEHLKVHSGSVTDTLSRWFRRTERTSRSPVTGMLAPRSRWTLPTRRPSHPRPRLTRLPSISATTCRSDNRGSRDSRPARGPTCPPERRRTEFRWRSLFALKDAQRGALRDRLALLTVDRSPVPALRKRDARWMKPELVVGVDTSAKAAHCGSFVQRAARSFNILSGASYIAGRTNNPFDQNGDHLRRRSFSQLLRQLSSRSDLSRVHLIEGDNISSQIAPSPAILHTTIRHICRRIMMPAHVVVDKIPGAEDPPMVSPDQMRTPHGSWPVRLGCCRCLSPTRPTTNGSPSAGPARCIIGSLATLHRNLLRTDSATRKSAVAKPSVKRE
jgi:hypothetical protein